MSTYIRGTFDAYRQYASAILRMRDSGKPLWKIAETFGIPEIRLEREFRLVDEVKAATALSRWPKAKFVIDAKDRMDVGIPANNRVIA